MHYLDELLKTETKFNFHQDTEFLNIKHATKNNRDKKHMHRKLTRLFYPGNPTGKPTFFIVVFFLLFFEQMDLLQFMPATTPSNLSLKKR